MLSLHVVGLTTQLTIATSLVPYKSLCWSLASFTPDVMQSEIRSPIALGNRYKRNYLLLTSSIYITRLQSLIQSIQLINKHLQESRSRFSLSLTTRSISSSSSIRWFANPLWRAYAEGLISFLLLPVGQFGSLDLHTEWLTSKSLPSFVQHPHSYNWMKFKTHTLSYKTYACKCLYLCPWLRMKFNSTHVKNLKYSICIIAVVGGCIIFRNDNL